MLHRYIHLMFLSAACSLSLTAKSQSTPDPDPRHLVGRWDIVVQENGKPAPSWLEVEVSGIKTLVGRFVGNGGSARPISEIKFDSGNFRFSIPPQWDRSDKDLVFQGTISGGAAAADQISGTIQYPSGQTYTFTGNRAPYLTSHKDVNWGKPIQLFNGVNLDGWEPSGDVNQWFVKDGQLISPHAGSNLISTQKFKDFKLHVEFKYGNESNSGVYLRGRYEVQIIDNPATDHPNSHLFGGVYGFLTPSEMTIKGPDQWQSFDITLVGRMVTIVANGKTIICNQEIPGITGGALDSDEGAPGPIYFQGDHGPIVFRNIVITPAE